MSKYTIRFCTVKDEGPLTIEADDFSVTHLDTDLYFDFTDKDGDTILAVPFMHVLYVKLEQ